MARMGDYTCLFVLENPPKNPLTIINNMSAKHAFLSNLQSRADQTQPPGLAIMVEAVKVLADDMPLHTEQSCTQLAYH